MKYLTTLLMASILLMSCSQEEVIEPVPNTPTAIYQTGIDTVTYRITSTSSVDYRVRFKIAPDLYNSETTNMTYWSRSLFKDEHWEDLSVEVDALVPDSTVEMNCMIFYNDDTLKVHTWIPFGSDSSVVISRQLPD